MLKSPSSAGPPAVSRISTICPSPPDPAPLSAVLPGNFCSPGEVPCSPPPPPPFSLSSPASPTRGNRSRSSYFRAIQPPPVPHGIHAALATVVRHRAARWFLNGIRQLFAEASPSPSAPLPLSRRRQLSSRCWRDRGPRYRSRRHVSSRHVFIRRRITECRRMVNRKTGTKICGAWPLLRAFHRVRVRDFVKSTVHLLARDQRNFSLSRKLSFENFSF